MKKKVYKKKAERYGRYHIILQDEEQANQVAILLTGIEKTHKDQIRR